jgi:hypothetical protein
MGARWPTLPKQVEDHQAVQRSGFACLAAGSARGRHRSCRRRTAARHCRRPPLPAAWVGRRLADASSILPDRQLLWSVPPGPSLGSVAPTIGRHRPQRAVQKLQSLHRKRQAQRHGRPSAFSVVELHLPGVDGPVRSLISVTLSHSSRTSSRRSATKSRLSADHPRSFSPDRVGTRPLPYR